MAQPTLFVSLSHFSSPHLKVLLHIEEKLFAYLHQALFREDNGKAVSDCDPGVTKCS